MDPVVESALISAAATLVGVGGTVAVAIVGFRTSRSTNQATIDAARATADKTIEAARDTNKATIDAAHADVRRTWIPHAKGRSPSGSPARSTSSATLTWMCGWAGSTRLSGSPLIHLATASQSARS
jgi:hypothetical protein